LALPSIGNPLQGKKYWASIKFRGIVMKSHPLAISRSSYFVVLEDSLAWQPCLCEFSSYSDCSYLMHFQQKGVLEDR
jgi:hypothetical protein